MLFIAGVSSCGEQQSAQADKTDTASFSAPAPVFSDTINSPRLVTQDFSDSLVLTAETGKGIGPKIKYMPEWRAFGWFTSADSVVWDVEVKNAGDYDVMLEWSVDDGEAGKEFILSSGAKQLTGSVGKSGSWETYKTESIGTMKLEAGRQNIVFKSGRAFSADSALLDLRNLKFIKK